MKTIVLLLATLLPLSATAQEVYKCKTSSGSVYQDRPCKGEMPAPKTTSPAPVASSTDGTPNEAQARLDRDKKTAADNMKAREKINAKDQIKICEDEAAFLQSSVSAVASAPREEYVPNRVGIEKMKLDEERRQTELSSRQSAVEAKRRECDHLRRAYDAMK